MINHNVNTNREYNPDFDLKNQFNCNLFFVKLIISVFGQVNQFNLLGQNRSTLFPFWCPIYSINCSMFRSMMAFLMRDVQANLICSITRLSVITFNSWHVTNRDKSSIAKLSTNSISFKLMLPLGLLAFTIHDCLNIKLLFRLSLMLFEHFFKSLIFYIN